MVGFIYCNCFKINHYFHGTQECGQIFKCGIDAKIANSLRAKNRTPDIANLLLN